MVDDKSKITFGIKCACFRRVAAGDGYRRSFDIYEKGLYVVVIQDCSLPQEGDVSGDAGDDDAVEGTVVMRNTADSAFPLAEHFSFERHGKMRMGLIDVCVR